MATEISSFHDISGNEFASDFETATTFQGASVGKCYRITLKNREECIIMPKWQALLVASQIAESFGYKVTKQK